MSDVADPLCWEVVVWDSLSPILLAGSLPSGVWVYISFVCLVSLLSFVKWEIQIQFIRKIVSKEKERLF